MLLKTGLLGLLGLLWSVRLSAIKAAGVAGVPVHVVVTFTALGIALFLTALALLRRDWPPFERGALWFYGLSALLGFLAPFVLETTIAPHLPVFLFAAIIATMPFFTVGLATAKGQERLRPGPALAIGLGFAGALVILWETSRATSPAAPSPGWVLAAFGVPLLYALNSVIIAARWPRHASPANVAQAQAIIVSVAAVAGGLATGSTSDWPLGTLQAWAMLLIVLAEGLALIVYLRMIRDYGATYVSLANFAATLCAAVIGVAWFGDRLSLPIAAATVAIVGSVILFQRQDRA